MGTTLDNGIYLPDEGERNCYEGLAGNWVALDNHLGSTNIHVTINDKQAWNGHVADSVKHVTAEDKAKWDAVTSKADASALTAHTGDTTIHVTSADKQAWDGHVADSVKHVTAEDKNKWDAVTSKANDSDVVHKSGNETVSGIKNFTDDTYIKSLNFTNEVASTSSSGDATLPIILTVTYTDQTASKSARINLRITASGDKSLYPHENNQYALGLTSRKWSEVHATTYYYGSSDTEFSTKFVTTDTAQTISGIKSFSSTQYFTGYPSIRLYSPYDEVSVVPSAVQQKEIRFTDKNNTTISYFVFQHRTSTVEPFRTCWRQNRFDGGSYYSVNFNNLGEFYPESNNGIKLGTSSNRWKDCQTYLINGLTPSSLSLPNLSAGVDISGYITNLNKGVNTYTPPANGWLNIRIRKTSLIHTSLMIYQTDGLLSSCETDDYNISGTNLPVIANRNVEIYIYADALVEAKFYPCQGNL